MYSSRLAGPQQFITPLTASVAALIAFLWISPYAGLVHDAQLYALQAATKLFPADLGTDLFVRFGSQDRYSLFPTLQAGLGRVLGLTDASLLLTIGSLLALFAGTFLMLLRLADRPRWCLPALLLAAVWPVPYGADAALNVAEPFCTPRMLASALGLIGLALALRGARSGAVGAWIAGLFVHPLMVAPAIAVGLLMLFPLRPLLLAAAVSCGLVLAAVMLGMPFVGMLTTGLDPDWAAVTLLRAPMLSPSRWSWEDWSLAIVSVTAPLIIGVRMEGLRRRLFLACAGVGVAGVIATFVGGDVLGSALVYQTQPWRALWISHWLGMAGLGLLLARAAADRHREDWIAVIGLAGAEFSPGATGWIVALMTLVVLIPGRRPLERPWRHAGTLVILLGAHALLWRLLGLPSTWEMREVIGIWTRPMVPPPLNDSTLWALVVAGLSVLSGGILTGRDCRPVATLRPPPLRSVLALSGVAALATVLWFVVADARRMRAFELDGLFGIANRDEVVRQLPPGGSVFWGMDGRLGWFGLRYPVYLSGAQSAGTVFFRETALEVGRRARHIESVLGDQRYLRRRGAASDGRALDAAAIRELCSDRELSAVHLPSPIEGMPAIALRSRSGAQLGVLALCDRR
ncbi:MAG: hypothetical protein RIS35_14 [Pseudomonadota bacterium]